MTKVTYIVNFHNQEDYIEKVINSIKALKGNFRKEYCFINDGSTDNSLELIKLHSKELTNSVVISKEYGSHSKYSPLDMAQGEYVKFVAGNEILEQDATINLLDSLATHGHRVAFGIQGTYENLNPSKVSSGLNNNPKFVINNPVSELLNSAGKHIKTICSSASLYSRDLLEEVTRSDNEVFKQDIFLLLKCAAKTNFVFCPKTISYKPVDKLNKIYISKEFEHYNKILAIRKLLDFDPQIAEKHRKEIYSSVISTIWQIDKTNYELLPEYILSKIYTPSYNLGDLKIFVDRALKKIFFKCSIHS